MNSDDVRKDAQPQPDEDDIISQDQLDIEAELKDGEYNADKSDVSKVTAEEAKPLHVVESGERHGTKKGC